MSKSTQPFQRIPRELRLELWNCEAEEIQDVIQNINNCFEKNGQPHLSFGELADIDEGRWACDLSLGRPYVPVLVITNQSFGAERG